MAELYYDVNLTFLKKCDNCAAIVIDSEQWKHNAFHDRMYSLDTEYHLLRGAFHKLEKDYDTRILELETELEKKQNPMFVINRENDGSLRIRPAEPTCTCSCHTNSMDTCAPQCCHYAGESL